MPTILYSTEIGIPLLNDPPGGGGKEVAATSERAAASSRALPKDFETEAAVTRRNRYFRGYRNK